MAFSLPGLYDPNPPVPHQGGNLGSKDVGNMPQLIGAALGATPGLLGMATGQDPGKSLFNAGLGGTLGGVGGGLTQLASENTSSGRQR